MRKGNALIFEILRTVLERDSYFEIWRQLHLHSLKLEQIWLRSNYCKLE